MTLDPIIWSQLEDVVRLKNGGMAELFLATQVFAEGVRKRIVLKRIRERFLRDLSVRALFIQEARLQSKLCHPHIVQLLDFGQQEDFLYMALEYIDGGDLCDLGQKLRVNDSQMRTQMAVQGLVEISSALILVHEHAIHQDLSAGNILYSKNGFFKLCDFGVAKENFFEREIGNSRLGQGKFRYMAPEQVSGGLTDQRSDIFALGLCFAEFVSGTKLYGDLTAADLLRFIRRGAYLKSISALDLPTGFREVILRCVQPSPNDRFQSAEELFGIARAIQAQGDLEFGPYSLRMALQTHPITPYRPRIDSRSADDTSKVRQNSTNLAKIASFILLFPFSIILFLIAKLRMPSSDQRTFNSVPSRSGQRRTP